MHDVIVCKGVRGLPCLEEGRKRLPERVGLSRRLFQTNFQHAQTRDNGDSRKREGGGGREREGIRERGKHSCRLP